MFVFLFLSLRQYNNNDIKTESDGDPFTCVYLRIASRPSVFFFVRAASRPSNSIYTSSYIVKQNYALREVTYRAFCQILNVKVKKEYDESDRFNHTVL